MSLKPATRGIAGGSLGLAADRQLKRAGISLDFAREQHRQGRIEQAQHAQNQERGLRTGMHQRHDDQG